MPGIIDGTKPLTWPGDYVGKIVNGDSLATLRTMPDECTQCCVTSPPYWGLRDYGTATWDGGDPNCDHSTARSRGDDILKGDKQGTSAGSRPNTTKLCKCGAKRIDQQLGLEQTPEIYVAKMVEVFREVRRVLKDDGTLFLNLGDSYASDYKGQGGPSKKQLSNAGSRYKMNQRLNHGLKPKDLVGIPWMLAFALRADGWYLRQDIIWHKPNPMPESVTDRCTKAHEYIFLLSKSAKYYYDHDGVKVKTHTKPHRMGSKKHKNNNDRNDGDRQDVVIGGEYRNKRSVWTMTTRPYKGAHFATFPPDLIRPCILAGCPQGGTVLDCFGGSGTTGEVAEMEGRNSILIELNPDYIGLAERRTSQMGLFCE